MRRNKKLASMVVASALVATTMAMPVMADGGEVPVQVQTKSAVIRVKVPTSLEVAVNQFEMGDTGSQIYSNDFTMDNQSEIPVKIGVTSTAELKNTTKLLSSKAAVGTSAKEGEAWLAVAAKTADDSYADGSTAFKDLTESSKNIKTFTQGTDAKATASQTFYLGKSADMKYKLLNAGEDATNISYAQFYKLETVTFTGSDNTAKGNELKALVKEKDVYSAVTANIAGGGAELTKIAKGTAEGSVSYADANTYYTANVASTAKDDLSSSDSYMYGNGDVANTGKAAFRYVGKLSGAQETWTKDDISEITIKYDILGLGDTKYDAVSGDCTYGLYVPTPVDVTGSKITNGGGTTDFDTQAKLATQLKGGYSVVFRVPAGTDLNNYGVTKIEVDGTEYQFTKGTAASTANSDGSTYTLKNFTASTAANVKVYYSNSATGEGYIIEYTIAS